MNRKIYWITFVAVMGGFIFGLNMAGISGAVNSIRDVFDLSDRGAGTGGQRPDDRLPHRFALHGRIRRPLRAPQDIPRRGRAVHRLVAGLRTGPRQPHAGLFPPAGRYRRRADSVIGPMYISEMAPADKRGRLVSFQQFAVVIGILVAYAIDYLLLDLAEAWRWMLGVPVVFGAIFFVLALTSLPESRRWAPAKGSVARRSVPFRIFSKARRAGSSCWGPCWPLSSRSPASMPS